MLAWRRRPETWPVILNLTPSKEKSIPWFLAQDWLRRAQAVVFILQLRDAPGDDKAKNEENFRALMRLLTEKKIVSVNFNALRGYNDGLEGCTNVR